MNNQTKYFAINIKIPANHKTTTIRAKPPHARLHARDYTGGRGGGEGRLAYFREILRFQFSPDPKEMENICSGDGSMFTGQARTSSPLIPSHCVSMNATNTAQASNLQLSRHKHLRVFERNLRIQLTHDHRKCSLPSHLGRSKFQANTRWPMNFSTPLFVRPSIALHGIYITASLAGTTGPTCGAAACSRREVVGSFGGGGCRWLTIAALLLAVPRFLGPKNKVSRDQRTTEHALCWR